MVSATRALRKRYTESKSVAAQESVPLFNRIIANMESGVTVEVACLGVLDGWLQKSDNAKFLSHNLQYA